MLIILKSNLLVTYNPSHKNSAMKEISEIMGGIEKEFSFIDSKIPGVMMLRSEESKAAIRNLPDFHSNFPEKFKYTYSWIPIEQWCSSSISEMRKRLREMTDRIEDKHLWKMNISKRYYANHRTPELIEHLTGEINRGKISLNFPEKIFEVHIIGELAGISLLDRSEIFHRKRIN